jgi:hypothetical protein
MRHWAKRAVKAALINSVVWLTPPPVHLLAAVMPLVSGYSIGSTAGLRWPAGWVGIGVVMGLTLGLAALAAGGIILLAAGLLLKEMPPVSYAVVVLIVSGGIGLYTAVAGSIGAIWGMRRGKSSRPNRAAPSDLLLLS